MDTTDRRIALALKKQRLLMKSAQLRQALAGQTRPLLPLFAVADRIQLGARWLKRHPALPVAVATALLVARPRAAFRWLRRGWFLWQTLRRLQSAAPSPGTNASTGIGLKLLQWARGRGWF